MKIYVDGSCLKNPGGPGGWGWWCPTTRRMDSGYVATTTNNRMELMAVVEAVKALEDDRTVRIYSDSMWSINVLTRRWKAKKNRDLIEKIWALPHWNAVRLHWVRGHNGHPGNVKADQLANAAARAGRAPDMRERASHPVRAEATSPQTKGRLVDDEVTDTGVRISEIGRADRADALERFEFDEDEYTEPSLAVLMGEAMPEDAAA